MAEKHLTDPQKEFRRVKEQAYRMLTITEKYRVIAADLAGAGFGTYTELLELPVKTIEQYRATMVISNILNAG